MGFTYTYVIILFIVIVMIYICGLFDCGITSFWYKAFRAIVVASARGLFGSAAIKRRDYRDPPCVKVYGKLYTANPIVLAALLYYTLAVVIVIILVSIGFSVHVSYGLDECSNKVDCFNVDTSDSVVNVTTIINCSLPADVDTAEDVQCYSFLPLAVIIALIGGYITLIPPLFLSFTIAIHTFVFESCLKYDVQNKKKNYITSILLGLGTSFFPFGHFFLIFLKANESEFNNNVAKLILKDTIVGQVSAALMTFVAFLIYPWFLLGRYRQYTPGEEEEKIAECKKPHMCHCKCKEKDDSLSLNVFEPADISMTKGLIEKH